MVKSSKKQLIYAREYYLKHKDNKEFRERIIRRTKEYDKKVLKEWGSFFVNPAYCEICGKKISFNSGNLDTSICFDHKWGRKEIIKISPSAWLRDHKRTLKNERIFKSCDFGILCNGCNLALPPGNRLEWLTNALIYTKGIAGRYGYM